jgi:hypothetical protein
MPNSRNECPWKQEALLEHYLAGGSRVSLSDELDRHLECCSSCRQYWNNLSAVRSGFQENSLYTSFLREKTLRRLAGLERKTGFAWLPLIIVASLLSLSLSYALPGWLLSRIYSYWISSPVAVYVAAWGTLLLVGTLVTMTVALALVERGYIHLGNGERRNYGEQAH